MAENVSHSCFKPRFPPFVNLLHQHSDGQGISAITQERAG